MSADPGPVDPATAWEWLWRVLHRAPEALLAEIAEAVEAERRAKRESYGRGPGTQPASRS